ncbi:curved DNA-binding protein CbpA [Nocardioides luteus]|uniref:J domain-containing protein n=1 Tax=Nocardioides luteus TaxID=1844 RepID=A0ABQ5T0X9_9ACTN|nr:DnaJ domain-containing protein [Nocardioides luteus]MDR7310632.1 curved DNA-binding protein CbpA [Nocardioides luteus]GGR41660.1 hypothetical protein GCM10010197_03640 [Nocardioides luteus]GLJ69588.1 hypothetical protein GCM10017579_36240 [Nocardioides luteus]
MSGKFIDAYAVLQIGPDADDAAVRARHRELAKQYHPDRGGMAADGELMMRINRARDVLLDPAARATLDEELARRRREAGPGEPVGSAPESPSGTPPLSRDRRWRAEWGTTSPWATPPAGSSSPGSVPPPSRVRPSASRLRQAARQTLAANPALSSRQRGGAPKPPPAAPAASPAQPAAPQASAPKPAPAQRAPAQSVPQQQSTQTPPKQQPASSSEKQANAWSLYSVPLDGVSVASLIASVLMCSPLGFVLGIFGLARTADDKRRGRWAAVAGLAISSLTMLVVIGYVMQRISAPTP